MKTAIFKDSHEHTLHYWKHHQNLSDAFFGARSFTQQISPLFVKQSFGLGPLVTMLVDFSRQKISSASYSIPIKVGREAMDLDVKKSKKKSTPTHQGQKSRGPGGPWPPKNFDWLIHFFI